MANSDVLQALAAKYQRPQLNRRQQRELLATALYVAAHASGTAPTNAQWNTDIQAALTAFKGIDIGQRDGAELGIWWQFVITNVNAGIATATSSVSSQLSAAGYLQGISDQDLETLILYLYGRAESVLT